MPATDDDRLLLAKAGLGARLREVRQRRGQPLADVASAAGMATSYLSELERGHKLPTLPALLAIADVYGLLVTDLLIQVYPFGSDERPPQPPQVLDGRTRP